MRRALLTAMLAAGLAPAPAPAQQPGAPPSRYALAGGCWALRSEAVGRFVAASGSGYAAGSPDAAGAEPLRLQATALGRYLLYGRSGAMPAADGDGVTATSKPGPAADFRVVDDGAGAFRLLALAGGRPLETGPGGRLALGTAGVADPAGRFTFVPASGCATFPEIDTQTTGTPRRGALPYAAVKGSFDAALHLMSFEFIGGSIHCGRPWSPYGVARALVDCPDHGPQGTTAAGENVLSSGSPFGTHDPEGWPSFKGWPTYGSLTHEQTYYKWVERAWRAGERLVIDLGVDNAQLCTAYPIKRNPCDEMNTIRLEIADSYALQDYIDAQYGGPGKGWFRIVRDPFQARRVINQGKLAVVLGMETSRLFGCRLTNEVPQCSRQSIDRDLEAFYDLGVRDMLLVNKFDNALAGVAGDAGTTGIVVNTGNRSETGRYWQFQTCTGPASDKPQAAPPDTLLTSELQALLPPGEAPVYPPPPHCNVRGLSSLGDYLIRRMMDRGMTVDVDHLSVLARNQALDLLESRRYSGVISSHGWSTSDSFPRILALGGMVTPYADPTTSMVKEWRALRRVRSRRFGFAFGFGSDVGGFGAQAPPRKGPDPVTYPFRGLDPGISVDRQRSGTRTFDVNTDGVAQYGLYPDYVEDLRRLAGPRIVADLANGAEGYLDLWERAVGVPGPACQRSHQQLDRRGGREVRLGAGVRALLLRAGQPAARPGRAWRWCLAAGSGRLAAVLSRAGRVELVAGTGRAVKALGIGAGARAARLRAAGATPERAGLLAADAGRGARFVWGVSGGRVRFAAVAAPDVARAPRRLLADLRAARLR